MKKFFQAGRREIRRWLREPRVIWRVEDGVQRTTIEIRSWLPLVIFLVLLGWYVASPAPVVLMSFVAAGGMMLSAFLWARMHARGVRAQRRLRFSAMQVGDELEEQISLANNTLLPVIWAEFVDHSDIPGYTVSSARAADPRGQIQWRTHTVCTRRGVFQLGPWELRLGEPFGFMVTRQLYFQRQEILVYPPLAVLPESVLPHHGALGDHRPLNQPLRAETIASSMVRAYVPGDPLRNIHWRTTARRPDPYVKVFNPEAASNVWLVPDFDAGAQVGVGDDSSQETMVTVLVSLAANLLQQNLSVGVLASTENETIVLPRQGQPHLWEILQAVAPLQAVGENRLETVLTRAQALISGSDLMIVITPSLSTTWVAPLRRISRSRGGRGRAEVILLDPSSFGPGSEQPQAREKTPAEGFLPILAENGISAHLLRREDVRVISGYYGEISRWEFQVTGTGRAYARRAPRLASSIYEPSRPAPWKAVR